MERDFLWQSGGYKVNWAVFNTSTDAVTWTKQNKTFLANLSRVIFTGTKFVAIGGDGIIVESDDGLNWTEVSVRLTKRSLNSIAYGNGLLITPMTYYSEHALYLSADGGVSWTTLPALPSDAQVNRIKFMDGLFYAFSGRTVYTSPDGYNWTIFCSLTVSNANLTSLNDLIHVNNKYILVGQNLHILASTDGLNWTERFTGPEWNVFTSITYGNNAFVAVGGFGKVVVSEDGLTWNDANIYVWPEDDFVSVVYGNKQFVAVGHYGSIYSSTDGKTWTNRVYGGDGYLSQVIYTRDGFVAVGWDGLCCTSLDGIQWTKQILPGGSTGVAYGANGYYVSGWAGAILKSDKVHLLP